MEKFWEAPATKLPSKFGHVLLERWSRVIYVPRTFLALNSCWSKSCRHTQPYKQTTNKTKRSPVHCGHFCPALYRPAISGLAVHLSVCCLSICLCRQQNCSILLGVSATWRILNLWLALGTARRTAKCCHA